MRLKFALNRKGIGLLEVAFASTALGFSALSLLKLLTTEYRFSENLNQKQVVVKLMMLNTTELNSKQSQQLPAPGHCIARYYDTEGVFLRETASLPLASSECKDEYATLENEIKILWKISPASEISARFSPGEFLKLPQYVSTLKEIQLLGSYRNQQRHQKPTHLALTIFRRD